MTKSPLFAIGFAVSVMMIAAIEPVQASHEGSVYFNSGKPASAAPAYYPYTQYSYPSYIQQAYPVNNQYTYPAFPQYTYPSSVSPSYPSFSYPSYPAYSQGTTYYQPSFPVYPRYPSSYNQPTRRRDLPFGPVPSGICGRPWTTPGLGLAGDDLPLRVCVL